MDKTFSELTEIIPAVDDIWAEVFFLESDVIETLLFFCVVLYYKIEYYNYSVYSYLTFREFIINHIQSVVAFLFGNVPE